MEITRAIVAIAKGMAISSNTCLNDNSNNRSNDNGNGYMIYDKWKLGTDG